MAAYFQLIDKVYGQPTSFIQVDAEICEELGVPIDPSKYVKHWYGTIGFFYATGNSPNKVDELYDGEDNHSVTMRRINRFIAQRYEIKCWAGR